MSGERVASRAGEAAAARASSYVEARHRRGRLVVWTPLRARIEEILEQGALHAWAEGHPDRGSFPGRGTVYTVPALQAGPDRRARWAVRHYWRGGTMSVGLGDRYLRLGRPRPHRETAATVSARERGVRTPAVVAGATYVDGACYRCDLVTEVVPEVETLARALHRHDGTRDWLAAMARAGALLRSLAAAGVHHPDLNAHNILLPLDGAPAWVVDLDQAKPHRRELGHTRRHSLRTRMQRRLVRSVIKVGTPTGERLRYAEIERAMAVDPDES